MSSAHECIVTRNEIPAFISISHSKCRKQVYFNEVKVIDINLSLPIHNFTICVSPLHTNYNDVVQLIEMIETSKAFGADHFTFYNYSSGIKVDNVFQSYTKEGIVEVLPWKIPVKVEYPNTKKEADIHYYGQLTAMNDCLYRNMFSSRWVVYQDLDEILVPLLHDNWFNMLRHANVEWVSKNFFIQDNHFKSSIPGSYLISNVFIPSQWKNNSKTRQLNFLSKDDQSLFEKIRPKSITSKYCEKKIYSHYVRSKYIVWSRLAEYMEVHQASTFIYPGLTQLAVPQHTALLYHIREWHDESSLQSSECSRLVDFSSVILPQVLNRYKKVFNRAKHSNF